ncbi:MAG TPA: endonuclease domain-containing protein, partial [Adhaeribacter sp.]|nr:endonuclease domain-containing protein [Adhaeribacter sp.]
KNQTPAEDLLWQFLRKEQLQERKFRRQHSIENYIVDFYCASEKLIIEIDGTQHQNGEIYFNDGVRDARLQQLNYRVLRFTNQQVFNDIEAVLNQITSTFQKPEAA